MADRRVDRHGTAHRVEPRLKRCQPDVPLSDALLDDRRLETRPVVGDGEYDEQRLRGRPADVFQLGIDDEVATGLVLAQQFRTPGASPSWASTCGCSAVTVERRPAAVSLSAA